MLKRFEANPILTKDEIRPSREDLHVVGVFNPGACVAGDEIVLVLRVAEACRPEKGWVSVPVIQFDSGVPVLAVKRWKMHSRHTIDTSDPRVLLVDNRLYLTSLSHFRLARSRDGVNFTVDDDVFMWPCTPDERFGVEDPRISLIEGRYYIAYAAVSENGVGVKLAVTGDFRRVERLGMVFHPQNKDVCLFPEPIAGHYVALHRPFTLPYSAPSIWYAESPDLRFWGNHGCLLQPQANRWEAEKIGAGPQPLRTPEGWLVLYHGCGADGAYALFLCLLDLQNPRRILYRSRKPILAPEAEWERNGFMPNVVFSNGWVALPDGRVLIYYGAADDKIGAAETSRQALLDLVNA